LTPWRRWTGSQQGVTRKAVVSRSVTLDVKWLEGGTAVATFTVTRWRGGKVRDWESVYVRSYDRLPDPADLEAALTDVLNALRVVHAQI